MVWLHVLEYIHIHTPLTHVPLLNSPLHKDERARRTSSHQVGNSLCIPTQKQIPLCPMQLTPRNTHLRLIQWPKTGTPSLVGLKRPAVSSWDAAGNIRTGHSVMLLGVSQDPVWSQVGSWTLWPKGLLTCCTSVAVAKPGKHCPSFSDEGVCLRNVLACEHQPLPVFPAAPVTRDLT